MIDAIITHRILRLNPSIKYMLKAHKGLKPFEYENTWKKEP